MPPPIMHTNYVFCHVAIEIGENTWIGKNENESSIKEKFEKILEMTISQLHDVDKLPFALNPYMIGMTYANRFFHHTKNSEHDISIPHEMITSYRMLINWKLTSLSDGPLTGIVFLSDDPVRFTGWIKELMKKKALPIGKETIIPKLSNRETSASFFVANKMVVFAINYGIRPQLKKNAEFYQLFTLSIARTQTIEDDKTCTITTRTFSDLLSVANALCTNKKQETGKKDGKEEKDNEDRPGVTIVLGYSDFYTDKVLCHLGYALPKSRYCVDFYFKETRLELPTVLYIMEDESKWLKERNGDFLNPPFENDSIPWSFILSSTSSVIHRIVPHMATQPVVMTIPLNVTVNCTSNSTGVERPDEPEEFPKEEPQESTSNKAESGGQRAGDRAGPPVDQKKATSEDGKKSEIKSQKRTPILQRNKIHPESMPESLPEERMASCSLASMSVSGSRTLTETKWSKPTVKSETDPVTENANESKTNIVKRETDPFDERTHRFRSGRPEAYLMVASTHCLVDGKWTKKDKKTRNRKSNPETEIMPKSEPDPEPPGHPNPETVEKKRSIQINRRNNDKHELLEFAEVIIQLLATFE